MVRTKRPQWAPAAWRSGASSGTLTVVARRSAILDPRATSSWRDLTRSSRRSSLRLRRRSRRLGFRLSVTACQGHGTLENGPNGYAEAFRGGRGVGVFRLHSDRLAVEQAALDPNFAALNYDDDLVAGESPADDRPQAHAERGRVGEERPSGGVDRLLRDDRGHDVYPAGLCA